MRNAKVEARTIDEYLGMLGADQRAALQRLRRAILAAAPGAEECISYRMPAFRLDGRVLVWFGAATGHCAFYPGAHPIAAHGDALARWSTSKGTIRFPATEPLPDALVRTLVRTRIAEQRTATPKGKKPAKPAKPTKTAR